LLKQPTPGKSLDHERFEVGAGGVKRSGVASGPAADDDHVFDVLIGHFKKYSVDSTMLAGVPEPVTGRVPGVSHRLHHDAEPLSTPPPLPGAGSSCQRCTVLRSCR